VLFQPVGQHEPARLFEGVGYDPGEQGAERVHAASMTDLPRDARLAWCVHLYSCNRTGPIIPATRPRRTIMADTIREKIESAGEAGKNAAKKAGEKVKEGADKAAEKTADAARTAGEKMKEAGEKLKDKSGA